MIQLIANFEEAIRNKLLTTVSLTDIVEQKIYPYIPQNTELPYIRFSTRSSLARYHGDDNLVSELRVQIFTKSKLQALEGLEHIHSALDKQEDNIAIAGGELNSIHQVLDVDVFQEEPEIWQGFIIFKGDLIKL